MFAASLAAASVAMPAAGQLRIVTYNTLDKPIDATAEAQASTIFGAIAQESVNGIAQPVDILLLQEQRTIVGGSTVDSLADVLNALHNTTSYRADVIGFGTDRLAAVYNSATVDLLDSRLVGVGIRPGYRGHFRPVGYTDAGSDFYAYSAHFRAGSTAADRTSRASEANILTNNGDSLGQGANIIYAGDFNVGSASEDGYQNFFAQGAGQAVDPTGATFWSAATPLLHTQSTRTATLADGGAPGGLDDRFDFQLVTEEVNDGSGFAIITPQSTGAAESSYRAFGNDGVSFNQAINNTFVGRSQPATVLNALHNFSDHLPVVADYQLPALAATGVSVPATQAFVGAPTLFFGEVQNIAPVSVAAGADSLDYIATSTGDVIPGIIYNDSAAPLAAANAHLFGFDTSSAGAKTASFEVNSLSDGVADRQESLSIDVFDHANGSFAAGSDLNALTIDFGSLALNAAGGQASEDFSIANLLGTAGFTSALSITDPAAGTGDDEVLALDLSLADVVAGGISTHTATFDTTTAGAFSATWQIVVGDALDLAGALFETLTLNLVGEVVAADFIDGDFNGDGFVGQADLDLALLNFGSDSIPAQWLAVNQFDGVLVSQNELDAVLLNFGNGAATVSAASVIPEPTSFALLGLGGLGLIRRRTSARASATRL